MGDGADRDGPDRSDTAVSTAFYAVMLTAIVGLSRPPCSDLGGVPDPVLCIGGLGFTAWKLVPVFVVLWIVLYTVVRVPGDR